MSSREDKYLFLFGLFLIIVFAIAMIALAIAVNNYSAQDDSKKPVALETNSIGCTKYRYKGDNYWKCPKGSGINQIEESVVSGKMTKQVQVPVVEEN